VEPATLIPLERLSPSSTNVRVHVPEEAVRRLAEDIAMRGLLHPLIVRPEEPGYGVVCGRMRLEAIKLLQRERQQDFERLFAQGVPCVVRELSDREAVELSLSENLRQNTLTPEEVGRGIARLHEMGLSPEEIRGRLLVEIDTVQRAIRMYARLKGVVELVAAAKAGRPPRRPEKRARRVSRVGVVEVARRAEELAREVPLDAGEVVKAVAELAAEHGLSMNEMKLVAELVARARPKSSEEVRELAERAVKEVRAADYRERIVLIRRDILGRVEAYAAERGITFHEAVNELLSRALGSPV
jgi:ParB family chromosome partitioning protein